MLSPRKCICKASRQKRIFGIPPQVVVSGMSLLTVYPLIRGTDIIVTGETLIYYSLYKHDEERKGKSASTTRLLVKELELGQSIRGVVDIQMACSL